MIALLLAALIAAPAPITLTQYIAERNPAATPYAAELAVALKSAAAAHDLDWRALAAVAWIESRYVRTVGGKAHESGVMQVRTVDLGLSTPWGRLRRAGKVPKKWDRPWRQINRRTRVVILQDIPITTYLGAWCIAQAIRICRRLGHRVGPYKGQRLSQLGRRYHRDNLERWGHYNSGIRMPRRGYMRALRKELARIKRLVQD